MTEENIVTIRDLAIKGQKVTANIASESCKAGSGLTDYHCSKSPLAADIKARTRNVQTMAAQMMGVFKQIEEETRK